MLITSYQNVTHIQNLEPASAPFHVGRNKILIRFREVNNPFDQSNDGHHWNIPTNQQTDNQHNDPHLRIPEDEFMKPESAQHNCQDSSKDPLICTRSMNSLSR